MKWFNIIENIILISIIIFCLWIVFPQLGETLRGYGKLPDAKAWISMIAIEFCGQELLGNYNKWKIKKGI